MEQSPSPSPGRKGRLYIVGIGPGDTAQMTGRAIAAIRESEYVLGNDTYMEMISPLLEGKKLTFSCMGKELDRAGRSVELARDSVVSIVSGGDPGVYGMASIVLEMAEKNGASVDIEVLPGVTAAGAAASRLGSPLSGDFVVLSLSDRLTPREIIDRRLSAAFSMGIPVVIYNPRSHGRPRHFMEAMAMAKSALGPDVPVGVVKNAFRPDERAIVTTLGRIGDYEDEVDMHTTVIVGGSESRIWRTENGERIITPRGYHNKYIY
jgi:precorrin-3B C17-methyltransferase